jgi:hypothetical protein
MRVDFIQQAGVFMGMVTARPAAGVGPPAAPGRGLPSGGGKHRLAAGIRIAALAVVAAAFLAGCGFFGKSTPPDASAAAPEDPFADGVLRVIVAKAPPGSVSQSLAGIADQLGWESQLQQNRLLRQAILSGQFDQRVQPFLLSLFFRNGYSVLPTVGDGHQVNRDAIIRGVAGDNRILVSTREAVRIIFLAPVKNVQVIYPQDGTEPQVFTVEGGVVSVRKSLSDQFLR